MRMSPNCTDLKACNLTPSWEINTSLEPVSHYWRTFSPPRTSRWLWSSWLWCTGSGQMKGLAQTLCGSRCTSGPRSARAGWGSWGSSWRCPWCPDWGPRTSPASPCQGTPRPPRPPSDLRRLWRGQNSDHYTGPLRHVARGPSWCGIKWNGWWT